jgi:hypothetical protein
MPYLGEDDNNLKLKNIINNSISGTSKPYDINNYINKEYHKQLKLIKEENKIKKERILELTNKLLNITKKTPKPRAKKVVDKDAVKKPRAKKEKKKTIASEMKEKILMSLKYPAESSIFKTSKYGDIFEDPINYKINNKIYNDNPKNII